MNNGHVGPVRFITSVEVLKNQPVTFTTQISTGESPAPNTTTTTSSLYKTVVISGGEGYEEYKGTVNSSGGSSSNAFDRSSSNSTQQYTNLTDAPQVSVGAGGPNSPSGSFFGSSVDETTSGKEDATNYLLTWDI